MRKNSYDSRIVNYETLHKISDLDFRNLVDLVNPLNGDKILDAGCGYGAVTRELLKFNKELFCYLLDNNLTQINRAINFFLENYEKEYVDSKLIFVTKSIENTHFKDKFFDKVICKMLLHEIQIDSQHKALSEIYRILNNNGRLIIWDVLLNDNNSFFFRSIITAKDKFANFKTLASKRYFFTEDEIINNLKHVNFVNIKKEIDIIYIFSTYSRYMSEFKGNDLQYNKWVNYIRELSKSYNDEFLNMICYKDFGNDIVFNMPKGIIVAYK